ncbi:MAG TPA: PKD-like family lipoprotein, partial [Puia sp.]|nr:PKD-like family lipoprotein [Puia sp.]
MKKYIIYILAAWSCGATACYKDKGNYVYHVPPAPVITNLDTVYQATVGDSLVIQPSVAIDEPAPRLGLHWKITVPEQLTALEFQGPALRTVFGLNPTRYYARLTITDSTNGMKYFYDFAIDGKTVFASGTTVLSEEAGVTELSFIKPDGTILPRIYGAINDGETLPAGPMQVV